MIPPASSTLTFEDFPIEDIESDVSSNRIAFDSDDSRHNLPTDPEPPVKRRRKGCTRWIIFILLIIAALGVTFYLRYCTPYTVEAQERGYITRIEKRGLIFKTFEGDMVVASAIADTSRIYDHNFSFSIYDESLARRLQQYAGTSAPVIISYEKYYATLPWRGDSKIVAVGFEPVDD